VPQTPNADAISTHASAICWLACSCSLPHLLHYPNAGSTAASPLRRTDDVPDARSRFGCGCCGERVRNGPTSTSTASSSWRLRFRDLSLPATFWSAAAGLPLASGTVAGSGTGTLLTTSPCWSNVSTQILSTLPAPAAGCAASGAWAVAALEPRATSAAAWLVSASAGCVVTVIGLACAAMA